jgi:hypothetical protein
MYSYVQMVDITAITWKTKQKYINKNKKQQKWINKTKKNKTKNKQNKKIPHYQNSSKIYSKIVATEA